MAKVSDLVSKHPLSELRRAEVDIHDLVRISGVARRTIHRYIAGRVIPRGSGAGRGTRYGWPQLARLLFAKLLRGEGTDPINIPYHVKKTKLEVIEERLVEARIVASDAAPVATPPAARGTPAGPAPALAAAERWMRVPVMPGLDLVVREDASEIVRRVAAEVQARYRIV